MENHSNHMRSGYKQFAKTNTRTASLQQKIVSLDDSMEAIPWKICLSSENDEKTGISLTRARFWKICVAGCTACEAAGTSSHNPARLHTTPHQVRTARPSPARSLCTSSAQPSRRILSRYAIVYITVCLIYIYICWRCISNTLKYHSIYIYIYMYTNVRTPLCHMLISYPEPNQINNSSVHCTCKLYEGALQVP